MFISEKAVSLKKICLELDVMSLTAEGPNPVFAIPLVEYVHLCNAFGISEEILDEAAFATDVIKLGMKYSGYMPSGKLRKRPEGCKIPVSTWRTYRLVCEGQKTMERCSISTLEFFRDDVFAASEDDLCTYWKDLCLNHLQSISQSIKALIVIVLKDKKTLEERGVPFAIVDLGLFKIAFSGALRMSEKFLSRRNNFRSTCKDSLIAISSFANATLVLGCEACLLKIKECHATEINSPATVCRQAKLSVQNCNKLGLLDNRALLKFLEKNGVFGSSKGVDFDPAHAVKLRSVIMDSNSNELIGKMSKGTILNLSC